MTNEEALSTLRDFISCLIPARVSGIEYRRFEAFAKAIEALEKQIPKKPKWIYGKDMGIAKCSVCGKELHYYMKGCPECLNAIDWSDNK